MNLYQLMYVSRAVEPFSEDALTKLVEQANENNRHQNITGNLLYNGGVFLQLLEGDADDIRKLYDHIAKDPRHHKVTEIYFEPATFRLCTRWSMRLINLEADARKDLSGIRDILERSDDSGRIEGIAVPVVILQEFSLLD